MDNEERKKWRRELPFWHIKHAYDRLDNCTFPGSLPPFLMVLVFVTKAEACLTSHKKRKLRPRAEMNFRLLHSTTAIPIWG